MPPLHVLCTALVALSGAWLGLQQPAATAPEPSALVGLGESLFLDPLLSRDRSIACSSCHDPARAFTDGKSLSPGIDGHKTERNTPTILNRAFGQAFGWDGAGATLEAQALRPIANAREMGLALDELEARLRTEGDYPRRFQEVFGAPPERELLGQALAAYMRTQTAGESAVERFNQGEVGALNSKERAGKWIFESRGGCWRCHTGPNWSDEAFHATGANLWSGGRTLDAGRLAVTGEAADRGKFKTPTLRMLARTAPYQHDGAMWTLEATLEGYRVFGGERARQLGLDVRMEQVRLEESDLEFVAAFLRALSRPAGSPPPE